MRCLGRDGDRFVIAVGRNKQAKVSADRVVVGTGLTGMSDSELEAFSGRVKAAAEGIDLREVWELVVEDGQASEMTEIGDLYFGPGAGPEQLAALATHLETKAIYFERRAGAYFARPAEEIERAAQRRRKEVERREAETNVLQALAGGRLPDPLSEAERHIVADIRGLAVHGEESPRAEAAKTLLAKMAVGPGDLQRRAFDLLVASGEMAPDEPIEIERAGVPVAFSAEVEEEARNIAAGSPGQPNLQGRTDLTSTPLVTIDDWDTRDRDDALSAEDLGDGRLRIGVHIADAGVLIPINGEVDREAGRRMSTLYTPDMRVPMMPAAISEGAGSILPGEPRLALSLLATLEDGVVIDWELAPTVVRIEDALTYEEVDATLGGREGRWLPELRALDAAADRLRAAREAAGALVLERPELSLKVESGVDGDKRVSVEVLPRTTPARRLVTEMMVLCNVMLARFCVDNGIPAAYRVQAALDSKVDREDLDGDPVAQYRLMGRIAPAEISIEPGRHHGLGVPVYLQATSPLRRYPDLVMQRQVSHYLANGAPRYDADEIASVAHRAEVQLRELAAIEGQRRRYWFVRYLNQRLEEGLTDYEAVVLDTERRGPPMLELADYPFRVRSELPSGASARDRVTLRLHDVDLWRRVPHFAAVE